MPPKAQYSKQQILDTALQISIKSGISSLPVRKLAGELGCSVAPIYVNFQNSDALIESVMGRIREMSWEYATKSYTNIGFFNIGIGQILFVKDYPCLYLDLLNFNHQCLEMPEEQERQMVDIMMNDKMLEGLSREQNRDLLLKIAIFATGLSIAIINDWHALTIEKAMTLLEETAHQLVFSQKNGFSESYVPF